MKIVVGDTVRIKVVFKNIYGIIADPTTIILYVKSPSGNISTYTYALGTATRLEIGTYYVDKLVDEAYSWSYRWEGAGALTAVTQDQFYVHPSNI